MMLALRGASIHSLSNERRKYKLSPENLVGTRNTSLKYFSPNTLQDKSHGAQLDQLQTQPSPITGELNPLSNHGKISQIRRVANARQRMLGLPPLKQVEEKKKVTELWKPDVNRQLFTSASRDRTAQISNYESPMEKYSRNMASNKFLGTSPLKGSYERSIHMAASPFKASVDQGSEGGASQLPEIKKSVSKTARIMNNIISTYSPRGKRENW